MYVCMYSCPMKIIYFLNFTKMSWIYYWFCREWIFPSTYGTMAIQPTVAKGMRAEWLVWTQTGETIKIKWSTPSWYNLIHLLTVPMVWLRSISQPSENRTVGGTIAKCTFSTGVHPLPTTRMSREVGTIWTCMRLLASFTPRMVS